MSIKIISSNILNEERETLLRYDYIEKCWYVDTSVPKHITKFKNQGWEIVSQTVNENGNIQAVEFKCNNPSSISIRNANKRPMTEDERKILGERLKRGKRAKQVLG